jgi:membrane-associated phospholipid phosphatase
LTTIAFSSASFEKGKKDILDSATLKSRISKPALMVLLLLLTLMGTFVLPNNGVAGDYLSAAEIASISAGTVGISWLGHEVRKIDTSKNSVITDPLPLDRSLQRFLGGEYRPGKTNFLDNKIGGIVTPTGAGALLLAANLTYPRRDGDKSLAQDMFLFVTGSIANWSVTGIAKGLVARPRPYVWFDPEFEKNRHSGDFRLKHTSFFSGHSSGAFYSMTYLNLRLRSIMRNEMSAGDYRNWRWAPPAILYGWASLVAWSRIHAYRHYFSDVAAGALVGYLIAELFYSFNDDILNDNYGQPDSPPVLFRVTFTF